MSRTKDQWLDATGGIQFGETPEQFASRVAEIQKLESLLISGTLSFEQIEATQRHICELKGIDFDADDE